MEAERIPAKMEGEARGDASPAKRTPGAAGSQMRQATGSPQDHSRGSMAPQRLDLWPPDFWPPEIRQHNFCCSKPCGNLS